MKKLLVALLMIPAMAHAEFWTGNDLYNRMQSTSAMDNVQAYGYVMGVYDVYVHIVFCPGTENRITVKQINDIAQQYLVLNPSLRNKDAYFLIQSAFKNTWPCANNRGAIRS